MSNLKYPQMEWSFRGLLRNTKRDDVLAGFADPIGGKDLKFQFASYIGRRFLLHFTLFYIILLFKKTC
jgi:hypothetical protein